MFKLNAPYRPTGDQPSAIDQLTERLVNGYRDQVLLGVTGSGKTFSVANVIEKIQRPTLIISHNKTLAAQLYQEYRDFFPDNAVSYFVSYYDYYQPEAYIPQSDTYIEKETDVNDLIDKLRLQATTNLMTRKDVIVVASVSCIYNLGSPLEYERNVLTLAKGQTIDRRALLLQLTELQYLRSEHDFARGSFRVRGDTIDLWPAYEDRAVRIQFGEESITSLAYIDPISAVPLSTTNPPPSRFVLYPAKHYVTNPEKYRDVFSEIRKDLQERVKELKSLGRPLEAHRLAQRTEFDLEMIEEVGYVNGIENYSRYFDGRHRGEPPFTLLEYFKSCDPNFLTVIDESHITIPQLRGMYRGDRSRKQVLIEYGFRLPAALDNRPLTFEEFRERTGQTMYTTATPEEWELGTTGTAGVIEQLIRPTGLIDPEIEIHPADHQIPDLIREILKRKELKERVLVTTLTKRTAEALTEYLNDEKKIKSIMNQYTKEGKEIDLPSFSKPAVAYLHSDIHTLDRQDVLDNLRKGEVDVVVGINLLREGLDLPEVSLVAILDADQEGFLRSKTSLIQTMGRAARHVNGKVILYAHEVTKSMQGAIDEVNRRRKIQADYNLSHNQLPRGIVKPIREKLVERPEKESINIELPSQIIKRYRVENLEDLEVASLTPEDRKRLVRHLTKQMFAAADALDFELAAKLRDTMLEIKSPV